MLSNDILNSYQFVSASADSTYGMFMGGFGIPHYIAEIQRTTIGTSGSGEDFGDLSTARGWTMAVADATRGVCAGGGVYSAVIDYVTVAGSVGGTATDWGATLSAQREQAGSCCDETHGLFAGGYGSPNGGNVILSTVDHITIQTTGICTDWGDMEQLRYTSTGASTTGLLNNSYGVIYSGFVTSFVATASCQYLAIATTGSGADFGDCTIIRTDAGAVANNERSVVATGVNAGAGRTKSADYFAVGSTGTSSSFGDMNLELEGMKGANNITYGLFVGGMTAGNFRQTAMEYVTIASASDGNSFGDLNSAVAGSGGCSA